MPPRSSLRARGSVKDAAVLMRSSLESDAGRKAGAGAAPETQTTGYRQRGVAYICGDSGGGQDLFSLLHFAD